MDEIVMRLLEKLEPICCSSNSLLLSMFAKVKERHCIGWHKRDIELWGEKIGFQEALDLRCIEKLTDEQERQLTTYFETPVADLHFAVKWFEHKTFGRCFSLYFNPQVS
jgi:hypothetical protein